VKSPTGRVPLALRLAARLLPGDAREEVLGDLIEAWRARARTQSRWARARWTFRQPVAALSARIAARRRRGGSATPPLRVIRHRPSLGFSWLDVKLGVRMLFKQPILTVVAGLTLALGIPSALLPVHVLGFFSQSLPVDEGDRILGLRNWDLETNRQNLRSLHDFEVWKEELTSFQMLAAVRSAPRNVHSPDGLAAEVAGAEVDASLFRLLRVPPLMGRTLVAADQTEGAADVAVISEDLWAARFTRDPDIVGRVVAIGRTPHTIVGVMPAGFYFPAQDQLWLPLRVDPSDYAVGAGPDVLVIGRLADGVSRGQADVEIRTVGTRLAAEWPETHGRLRAEAVPFPIMAMGERAAGPMADWELVIIQLFFLALLAVACGNIGTLILARTAIRLDELAVRTALGASRFRILGQLFIEALVLSLAATGLGLLFAQETGTRIVDRLLIDGLPYWLDVGLSLRSAFIALGVGAGCAVVAGVLPAVRATSPRVQQNLQRNARGTTVRFGAWTSVLIVVEVALSVGFLCFGTLAVLTYAGDRSDPSLDPDRYLIASLRTPRLEPMDDGAQADEEAFRTRTDRNHQELRDRLAALSMVRHVGMGLTLPGTTHPDRRIIVEGTGASDEAPNGSAATGRVHVDFFRDMDIDVLQGRAFTQADVEGATGVRPTAVVVNRDFVDHLLGGGDAIGRRLRYPTEITGGVEEWYDIVGVVETFGTNVSNPDRAEAIYYPLGAADVDPMRYIVEVNGSPGAFIPRLREIAAEVDPEAVIQGPQPLAEVVARGRLEIRVATWLIFGLSGVGMLLAVTGLYALISFTVARRTREIGIRSALGASGGSVVMTIAKQALRQLLVGVGLGSAFGWWLVRGLTRQTAFAAVNLPVLVLGVAVAVIVLSALACLSPTLRGLRIQPTEALREA